MMLRRNWAQHIGLFLAVIGVILALLLVNGHLMLAGDNATYIVLGQSLALGKGYRLISDPREPLMALYPFGYPLLLAAVLRLTGNTQDLLAAIVPMKLLSIAFFGGSLVLLYDLLQKEGHWLATLVTLLTAANPYMLGFATEVQTEITFFFLSLLALWLYEKQYASGPSYRWLAMVAVVLGASCYIRSLGLTLAVALGLALLLRRSFREAMTLLAISTGLVLPWVLYGMSLPSTGTHVALGRSYLSIYLAGDPYGTFGLTPGFVVERLTQNLYLYGVEILPYMIFPHLQSMLRWEAMRSVLPFLAAGISLLPVVGLIRRWRSGARAMECYFALFVLSTIAYLWAQGRLLVPALPLILYYTLQGLEGVLSLGQALLRGRVREGAILLTAVLLLSALVVDGRRIARNIGENIHLSTLEYYDRDAPQWSNYLRAIYWIDGVAPRDVHVMCRKADIVYLLTGRQALEYPYVPQPEPMLELAAETNVGYIIRDAFTWTTTTVQYLSQALRDAQKMTPSPVTLVYRTEPPVTEVWKVKEN
ncbi:MAG: glycosyltransferase family 39 protein [Chloroflexi bacterium]|nr:glycosyltransferase family 39 protein [Chloroflexota bacterium]